jgi:hypothetical protein
MHGYAKWYSGTLIKAWIQIRTNLDPYPKDMMTRLTYGLVIFSDVALT